MSDTWWPSLRAGVDFAAGLVSRRHVRVGVTGLARAGKTAFLTSVAANLLALGAGLPVLPALRTKLAGRTLAISLAPSGADDLPRFDHAAHMASLAADPPTWPARTEAASLLALDLELGRATPLPSRRLRLEFLDYPGEWLLDLTMLRQSYAAWSDGVLRRLETPAMATVAAPFLAFASGLGANAQADEALAATGGRLYRALLHRLRDEHGLSFLQPGRMLMPSPGPAPPWLALFPARIGGGLGDLLTRRYDAYLDAVRRDLVSPLFGAVDRLVVLADLLGALSTGETAFADARASLKAASDALRWRGSWGEWLSSLLALQWPAPSIGRVVYAATKADHVAERQRGNLAALLAGLARPGDGADAAVTHRAIASVRCTEDFVWTLDGRPVSAVRGRLIGEDRLTRSYPGEVPDRPPDGEFWRHRFLRLPDFEPMRLPDGGRGGVPQFGLDALLVDLLGDVL